MSGKIAIIELAAAIGCAFTLGSTPIAANEDAAKQAYVDGVRLFEQGDYTGAADAFRKAYALKPTWKVLYNVGQSEAAAKRNGLALEAFEAYLTKGGDDVPDARREEVLTEVERLRRMIGSVKIDAPKGATVHIDEVERGKAPILGRLPVSAGVMHTAWAELDGEQTAKRDFKVMGADSIHVKLEFEAAGPVIGATDTPAEPLADDVAADDGGASPLAISGWVMVGVGGAMLVTGAITGAMALKLDKQLTDDCTEGHCPATTAYRNDIDKLATVSTLTDVMLFAGGAIAATGAVLLIVDAAGDRKSEQPTTALAPIVGPDFGGAAIQGRF